MAVRHLLEPCVRLSPGLKVNEDIRDYSSNSVKDCEGVVAVLAKDEDGRTLAPGFRKIYILTLLLFPGVLIPLFAVYFTYGKDEGSLTRRKINSYYLIIIIY